jgi:hypothetical protein
MSEATIQTSICEYLAYRKHLFWRSNNIPAFNRNTNGTVTMRRLPQYTMRGLPDIIVIREGLFIGLEVKKPGTYQSKEQKAFEKLCQEHKAFYFVVRSIDDVQAIGL